MRCSRLRPETAAWSTSASATAAPCAANARATARPIPRPAPVTTAIRPASRSGILAVGFGSFDVGTFTGDLRVGDGWRS